MHAVCIILELVVYISAKCHATTNVNTKRLLSDPRHIHARYIEDNVSK